MEFEIFVFLRFMPYRCQNAVKDKESFRKFFIFEKLNRNEYEKNESLSSVSFACPCSLYTSP
ncbi:MAG: hypothetical protein K2P54_02585, partial [Odoribacter sp.]|nr:hypothetical protein [Odoribacter sp.]